MTEKATVVSAAEEAAFKRAARSALARAIVAAAVIAAGVVTVHGIEKTLNLHFDKPPMPLRDQLSSMSKELGGPIPGAAHRYVALGDDKSMPEDQIPVLGTQDYLLRTYTDLSKGADDPTARLNVNLNYYATGSATPHVPEKCWVGNGMEEATLAGSRRVFDIPDVHHMGKDGKPVVEALRMRMISFWEQGGAKDPEHLRNVAYLFHVNGEYVALPEEVTSHFWKASNKYAYHAKIEVSVGYDGTVDRHGVVHGGTYCSQEAAQQAIAEFIRAALPEIEKCLPDPRSAEGFAAGTQPEDPGVSGAPDASGMK